MSERLKKWQAWVQGDLFDDVVGLFYERLMYRDYWSIVLEAPDIVRSAPNFHAWVRHNYARAVALGVRRQVDKSRGVISLWRLMTELAAAGKDVTRQWHVGLYSEEAALQDRANESFDRWGADHVRRRIVRGDIDQLQAATASAVQWVDSTVAHLGATRNEIEISLSFADLHAAVDVIIDLYERYATLLTGSHPVIEELMVEPWQHIFEVAWTPAD